MWSGWDGVGTAAVTLVGPIAYFTPFVIIDVANASIAKKLDAPKEKLERGLHTAKADLRMVRGAPEHHGG